MNSVQQTYIVAEITVNWPNPLGGVLISKRFEAVIETNDMRGYDLVSHSYSKAWVVDPPEGTTRICETIIAVFRRRTS